MTIAPAIAGQRSSMVLRTLKRKGNRGRKQHSKSMSSLPIIRVDAAGGPQDAQPWALLQRLGQGGPAGLHPQAQPRPQQAPHQPSAAPLMIVSPFQQPAAALPSSADMDDSTPHDNIRAKHATPSDLLANKLQQQHQRRHSFDSLGSLGAGDQATLPRAGTAPASGFLDRSLMATFSGELRSKSW